jgi:type I restriction enzyme M protein
MLDDIKKTLWATADKLRANMDAAEYKHLVLGLIFVKYISDTFAARRAELTTRLTNPDDDYFFGDADPADIEPSWKTATITKRSTFLGAGRARWEACVPPPSSPTLASASTTP